MSYLMYSGWNFIIFFFKSVFLFHQRRGDNFNFIYHFYKSNNAKGRKGGQDVMASNLHVHPRIIRIGKIQLVRKNYNKIQINFLI